MKAQLKRTVFGALVLASLVATGRAQSGGSFDLNWFTIDSGGGTVAGNAFALMGTIGQPDSGVMSGGAFTITGGFWAGFSGPGEALPRLSIRLLPGVPRRVVLYWPNPSSGFVLQRNCGLTGWSDVTDPWVVVGSSKEITLFATGQFCMFRLERR